MRETRTSGSEGGGREPSYPIKDVPTAAAPRCCAAALSVTLRREPRTVRGTRV